VHSQNGNSPQGDGEEELVYFRFIRTGAGGKPILPVSFATGRGSADVPAVLVPATPVTRLSPMWSQSIEHSPGQVVSAQLLDRDGNPAGPAIDLVPEVDAAIGAGSNEEWYATEGAVLGQDFLQHFTVGLLGPAQVVAVAFGDFGFGYAISAN
jgi:hypothetical protein